MVLVQLLTHSTKHSIQTIGWHNTIKNYEIDCFRFGHGAFLLCLEDLYKKITGKDLEYKALVGKPSEVTYRYAQQMIMDQANKINIGNKIKRLYAVG